jgi:hypothetical protein
MAKFWTSRDRRPTTPIMALALAAVALLATLLVAGPQAAEATESPYCGGITVSPKQYCSGVARTFNAEYGVGAQGSVCVGSGVGGSACSGGPNQGVYKPVGQWIFAEPWIFNNLSGQSNIVHGTAFTP